MSNVFLAAALLSGILAVSGCALAGRGWAGGVIRPMAMPRPTPMTREREGYAQPVQPYYQPQVYAYSGNPEVYAYPPAEPVPQDTQDHAAAPPGRGWTGVSSARRTESSRG